MDEGKKGSSNNHLTCDVCKIDFNSKADFALHEFSKKHCDNLIRLSKQKPVVSKQKNKNETPPVEKPPPKVNSVTHTGSFAKYGYFVPGQVYVHSEISREFNTDYDPYLQKFAENPLKEKSTAQTQNEPSTFSSVTSFNKKKKKKKIQTCQVCNVTFLTLPEYEAHMKSPQHIWKLKMTGMGVSAHFVKASTDLHTTDINEEPSKPPDAEQEEITVETATGQDNSSSGPFPLLYCSDCELLLNSPQQYNAHINGKLHYECAQRKAELKAKKEKLENPSPNQLYCFSCKISLNNLFQYNEHKNGKKHKTKCRTLIRKGITIPPEERVPGIPHLNTDKPVVYPELYEKFVLEKQKQKECLSKKFSHLTVPANCENDFNSFAEQSQVNTSSGFPFNPTHHIESNIDFQPSLVQKGFCKGREKSTEYSFKSDSLSTQTESDSRIAAEIGTVLQMEVQDTSEAFKGEKVSHENNIIVQASFSGSDEVVPEMADSNFQIINFQKEPQADSACDKTNKNEESKTKMSIDAGNKSIGCSICNESFQWPSQLDTHLGTEGHFKKILELKLSGKNESEILKAIFSDRNAVKPNIYGKFSCSICSVTTDNSTEFDQHLNSIVHKYTEKDYENKRALEVKCMVSSNENGLYFCKLCDEGWVTLVDYVQHLHFVKHRSIQRAQRAKVILARRKNSYLQKQRLMQNVKKRNLSLRRAETDKNPGVRTKVCGVATNLYTGTQAPVPNLEPLEPKIDIAKNASIGVCDQTNLSSSNNNNNAKLRIQIIKKRSQIEPRSSRKGLNAVVKRQSRGRCPFIPSRGTIPPLMPPLPYPRYPRPGFISPHRNWPPFPSPRQSVFGPFCDTPSPLGNPYFRPQRFLRPPWPRHRPPFAHS